MRKIITNNFFDKKFVKLVKKDNIMNNDIINCLKLLAEDIYNPKLKTHKLTGNLKEFYASSINYSYRIIFNYDEENIYLETIGGHDEVY